jgi:hypothetical protein
VGSNPTPGTSVMSRDIVPKCLGHPSTSRSPVGLVVPSRIEGELRDQTPFAQHSDVEVGHEHEHPVADEPTSQPDVVKPRVVAKRDRADGVDLVPSDPKWVGTTNPGGRGVAFGRAANASARVRRPIGR